VRTDHDPIDPNTLADMGYEKSDVEPRSLMWPAVFLFGGTIGAGLIAALLIRIWHIVPEVVVEQRPFTKVQPPVGTPILQNNSDNTGDIAKLRRDEALVLTSSGPASDPGYFHIPIDDAIRLVSQRGLPVTGTQTVTRPRTPTEPATAPVPAASSAPAASAAPVGGKP
jgi:hypothetical protein